MKDSTNQEVSRSADVVPYSGSREYLLDELRLLDVMLYQEVGRFRGRVGEDLRGLVITDDEVNEILRSSAAQDHPDAKPPEEARHAFSSLKGIRKSILGRRKVSLAKGIFLGLPTLSRLFNLAEIEEMVIIVCFAPEIDSKYGKLYAYLQDDVTKKRATVDLLFRLFCENERQRLELTRALSPQSPLLHHNLIQVMEEPHEGQGPLASRFVKLDDRIVAYLLENTFLDPRLEASVAVTHPRDSKRKISSEKEREVAEFINSSKIAGNEPEKTIIYLSGPDEGGKRSLVEIFCGRINVDLMTVNIEEILARSSPAEWAIKTLVRETILAPAVLFVTGFDGLLADEKSKHLTRLLGRCVEEVGGLVVLSGEKEWFPKELSSGVRFVSREVSIPGISARKGLWTELSTDGYKLEEDVDFDVIASKFVFGRDGIERALRYARNSAMSRGSANETISMKDIYEGCRAQSSQKLASMAQKVRPTYTWDDIVLPEDNKSQLREICYSVKHRRLVHEQWGFEKKFSLGKGVNILFWGSSGCGKTMAAEVIANELQLDMYKIDLSMVVSKWVGETEKNLSRVFKEARDMNAIIFFDEADALFGKRTETRDAHDRYANIEINFLLQKVEEHDGVVVLASNFKENIDKAFLRRMQHTVEFPFPDEESRVQIWKNIFPRDAPVSSDVDFVLLASKFKISGGNIKNAALGAGFYAAEESSSIAMKHVLRAVKREYQKMGTVPSETDFETVQPTRRDPNT